MSIDKARIRGIFILFFFFIASLTSNKKKIKKQSKKMQDDNCTYCIIHGVKVNIDSIKKMHPGGSIAISLAENRDISVLFDQYHFGTAIGRIHTRPKKNSFYEDLYTRAHLFFGSKENFKMSAGMVLFNSMVAIAAGACWLGWMQGSVLACLLLPFFQWLIFVNVGHEAGHFALSKNSVANHYACLFSHFLFVNTTHWYLQHAVSHHSNTNEAHKDFDLTHFVPYLRMHSRQKWNSNLKYQLLFGSATTWLTSTFAESIMYPLKMLFSKSKGELQIEKSKSLLKLTRFSCLLQVLASIGIIVYPFWIPGFSLSMATFFAAYPYFIGSILFMTFTQITHINENAQKNQTWSHWSEQMVDTSMDYGQTSFFWTYVSGGLNMQGLHHCLPSLSSSRYRKFYPIYREICKEHKIKIHETDSLRSALLMYCNHMKNLTFAE